jgi:hypothetical protein
VIQDIGLGVENRLQAIFMALEIGDQHLNRTVWLQEANLADGFGKHLSASEIVVVAINAGDDRKLESEFGNRFGDAARLIEIDWLRTPLGYSAKTAAPGAKVSEKHKRSGAMVPAFAYVGALRGFADRV